MNWNSAGEFFAMGGYGLFVWGSYAMVAVCMLVEPWLAWRRHRQALRAIHENQDEESV
jgi:heme exporter protein D